MNEATATSAAARLPLLRVENLAKTYGGRGGLFRRTAPVHAVAGVSFTVEPGTTFGIAGASGSGKSSVARCISRIERPDQGEVRFEGRDLARLSLAELRPFRWAIQMMFQDAATAMNPRFSAGEVIAEPLLIQGIGGANERSDRVHEAMREVGLSPDWSSRPAHQCSGGQRQRLSLARALVLRPKLLILDEPLTGLDLSTRAQIANLLLELQAAHRLAYVLISHDLSVLAHLADTIAVMRAGCFVEQGSSRQILSQPRHAETQKLLSAASRQWWAAGAAQ